MKRFSLGVTLLLGVHVILAAVVRPAAAAGTGTHGHVRHAHPNANQAGPHVGEFPVMGMAQMRPDAEGSLDKRNDGDILDETNPILGLGRPGVMDALSLAGFRVDKDYSQRFHDSVAGIRADIACVVFFRANVAFLTVFTSNYNRTHPDSVQPILEEDVDTLTYLAAGYRPVCLDATAGPGNYALGGTAGRDGRFSDLCIGVDSAAVEDFYTGRLSTLGDPGKL